MGIEQFPIRNIEVRESLSRQILNWSVAFLFTAVAFFVIISASAVIYEMNGRVCP